MAGEGISGCAAATKDDNSSTECGERNYDDVRNKCHRCLEPGHRWFDCTAHVVPAAMKSHSGSGEVIRCLTIAMLGNSDAAREREQSKDATERWIADSGATFYMTRSADLLRDLHPIEDNVKVDNDTLVGVEGYGSLTAAFSNEEEGIAVRPEKMAYVPDLAFIFFFL